MAFKNPKANFIIIYSILQIKLEHKYSKFIYRVINLTVLIKQVFKS